MKITLLSIIGFIASVPLFAQPATEAPEISSLRGSWTRAREQATQPIDQKYITALKALKDRFTKAGNLEAAIQADAELKKLETQVASPTNSDLANAVSGQKAPILGDWALTTEAFYRIDKVAPTSGKFSGKGMNFKGEEITVTGRMVQPKDAPTDETIVGEFTGSFSGRFEFSFDILHSPDPYVLRLRRQTAPFAVSTMRRMNPNEYETKQAAFKPAAK
jgi:hypothetical protein